MKKTPWIILTVATAVISVIGFIALGAILNMNGIYGPFWGDDYLTDWSNWKIVVLPLTIITTLLVAWPTRPRPTCCDQQDKD